MTGLATITRVLLHFFSFVSSSNPPVCCRSSSGWPPMFPHLLLAGVSLGSASNLASVTLASASHCVHSSLVLPTSYAVVYACLLVRLTYLHSLHRAAYKLSR